MNKKALFFLATLCLFANGAIHAMDYEDAEEDAEMFMEEVKNAITPDLQKHLQEYVKYGGSLNIPDKDSDTPLLWVLKNKNLCRGGLEFSTKRAHLLLEHGADPNIPDKDGMTPLHWAIRQLFPIEIVQRLLEKKADPNIADKDDRDTPLHTAARFGQIKYIQPLLNYGAQLNMRNKQGRTPLYFAAFNGYAECVKLLLEKGADPNIADNEGRTPLYMAASWGKTEIAQNLLNFGADPNIQDNKGNTPLTLAIENKHQEIADMLLEAMESEKIQRPPLDAEIEQRDECPICFKAKGKLPKKQYAITPCCQQFICEPCLDEIKRLGQRCPFCRRSLQ